MKSIVASALLFLLLFGARAQSQDDVILKHRPFQLSFLYPLGTNGIQSKQIANAVSFNMIAGFNGGLTGLEFGGFLNSIRYDAKGVQFAGFGNVVGRSLYGGQFAGFFNLTGRSSNGLQAAGFANIAGEGSKGIQLAGFMNVSGGKMAGMQIAGFMNVAKTLSGIQLGVFNYADTVDGGIPVGVFSFVRKGGYRNLTLGANETLFGIASIKMGVPKFYNIISIGIRPETEQLNWAIGYGIGSRIGKLGPLAMHLEAISYQLYEDMSWNINYVNQLNRVSLDLHLLLGRQLELYGGLGWNVVVSNRVDDEGRIGSSLVPYTTYNQLIRNTRVQMYPGLQAGISF